MTKRQVTTFASLILTIIMVAIAILQPKIAAPSQSTTPNPGFYTVVRDVDGDTIVVNMDGKDETVRFIGVDTPETHKPNTPVQCFGPQASNFTSTAVSGKTVRLAADPTNDNRDKYGRLLRYVYLEDGSLLDQTLVEQGYGFAYISFPFQKKTDFIAAQTRAQSAKLGLWNACQPYQEQGGRWQTQNESG